MPPDPSDYLGPYLRAVTSHGPGFPALLFGSRELQQRRFAVLTGGIPLAGRRVADLGSGHADLLGWLEQHHIDYRSYVGLEAVAPFDTIARERAATHERTRASFVRGDFVRKPELFEELVREHEIDTMIFSGSLNTLDESRALAALDGAWTALATRPKSVLGFNFLSGGGDWQRPQTRLPRRDTKSWLAWALERTPQLTFYQHYLGAHDATLIMFRGD